MFFFSNHNHERNTADMMIDDAPGLRTATELLNCALIGWIAGDLPIAANRGMVLNF
jgi:hypothetical protein